jgi:hypothetical protein
MKTPFAQTPRLRKQMMKRRKHMKTLTNTTYAALALVALAMSPLTANAGSGDLFASINGTTQNGGGSIFQYGPSGVRTTFASGLSRPRGVAFDSAGNLFVATNFYDGSDNCCQVTILKITPNGTQSTFANPSGYLFLQGLAIDNADNVFVSVQDDQSPTLAAIIYKFTPSGVQTTFGSFPGQPSGLAFDNAGNLYASANYESAASQILKFTPSGAGSVFATASDPVLAFAGLAFDRSGNLLVSTGDLIDPPNHSILKFTPQAVQSTFATNLNFPRGITFDSSGNLFVAELVQTGPGDILKFTPGGKKSVFASGIGRPQGNGGPEWLAFPRPPSSPVSKTINFDAINALSNPVSGATLKDYLKQYGVSINKVTNGSQVVVDDDRRSYGGGVVFASSPHSFLSNYFLNAPNSFTLNFDKALDSMNFTRIAGGPHPTQYASWTATALNASGAVLSSVSESFPGIANFPAKVFTLNGPGIVAVRFDSNGFGTAAFSAVLLDDLVLNYK